MKVLFSQNATKADVQCILMAKLGLSGKAISQHTGLTPGQVSYRCRAAGVKLKDYRDGVSPFSQRVIAAAHTESDSLLIELKGEIKRLMEKRDE